MSSKFLILPIEIKGRELVGKSLLAAFATRAGFDVLLGDQREIARSIHRLPLGIYLDKSVSRTKIPHYRRLKELGYRIAAWCEEGLVYRDKIAYQFERLSPVSMSLVDAFFAWGEVHGTDVMEAIPESHDKIHALGNPRFDLLRQPYTAILDEQARRLKADYGKFILVVTTFSRFNRHQGQANVLDVLEARGFQLTADHQAYYKMLVDHISKVFEAFQAMIPELAKAFPGHTVIVRPHPSEDHDRWREALAGTSNATVLYAGSVEPWLWAADAIIHNASTTGVEAFLLDRPVFSYMPVVDEEFNRKTHLPNIVSRQVHSIEELRLALNATFEGLATSAIDKTESNELVSRYIANASGPLASALIIKVLSDLYTTHPPCRTGLLRYVKAWSHITARRFLSQLRRIVRFDRDFAAYAHQKFPGLDLEEVKDTFRGIAKAGGQSVPAITPHPTLSGCYMISATASSKKEERMALEPIRRRNGITTA